MIDRVRTFLLRLLAGDRLVIINADINRCEIRSNGLVIDGRVRGNEKGHFITLWGGPEKEKFRQTMKEANKKYRELQRKFKR